MRTQAGSSRPLRALLPLLLLVLALCLSSSSCLLSSAQSFGDLRLLRMDLDPYRSEYYPGDASQPPTWSRGLLQVFNSSSAPGAADGWGTVCNDIFDQDDLGADVVCRQLGWPARAATYGRIWTVNSSRWVTTTNPGAASLTIMLDSVSCDGTESRLVDCSHDPLGVSDCRHIEDIAIDCFVGQLFYNGTSTGSSTGGDGGSCPGCTGGAPLSSSSSGFNFQWPVFFVASTAGALVLALFLICLARRKGTPPDGKHGSNKIHHRNRSAASSQVADRADDDGTKTVMTFMISPDLLASQKMPHVAVISPSTIAAGRAAAAAAAANGATAGAGAGVSIGTGTLTVPHTLAVPNAAPTPIPADAPTGAPWPLAGHGVAQSSLDVPRLSFLNNITPSATPRFQGVG